MLITAQAPTGSLILSLSPHRKDESNSHPSDTAKNYTAQLLRQNPSTYGSEKFQTTIFLMLRETKFT